MKVALGRVKLFKLSQEYVILGEKTGRYKHTL